MDLLELDGQVKAQPHPATAEVEEFRELIDEVDKPQRYLAYIYHMENINSPYKNYSDRERQVKESLFGDGDWDIPPVVQDAREKYRELIRTPEQDLLNKAIESIYKSIDWLEDFDPTERDDNNKLVYPMKDYVRTMEKLPGLVDTLEDLRERVDEGEGAEGDVRGGVEVNRFNRG